MLAILRSLITRRRRTALIDAARLESEERVAAYRRLLELAREGLPR